MNRQEFFFSQEIKKKSSIDFIIQVVVLLLYIYKLARVCVCVCANKHKKLACKSFKNASFNSILKQRVKMNFYESNKKRKLKKLN